ncbi:MAG: metal ABC transporter permease [Candidatus Methylacidiphilales bacterium]|nr:metal ABC transporter permease [Candidatus Methylacidiphilales bacterium]
MNWLLEPLHYEFFQRAFIGCLLVGFTNGFLSAYIILRRLALLADALSHSLLPGLAAGTVLFGLAPAGLFFGALTAGVLVCLGGVLISRSSRLKDEAAIGALYTMAFALGILLLRYSRVRVDLEHFLFGNILGLSDFDLWINYGISFAIVATLVALHRPLLLTLFEPSVAQSQGIPVNALQFLLMGMIVLAMISSLQAVGVVLSLGLLILPGATMYLLSDSFSVIAWGGGLLGMLGACVGLFLSHYLDVPSGPVIVLVLGTCFVGSYLFSPKYGIITRMLRHPHLHEESYKRWESKNEATTGTQPDNRA